MIDREGERENKLFSVQTLLAQKQLGEGCGEIKGQTMEGGSRAGMPEMQ